MRRADTQMITEREYVRWSRVPLLAKSDRREYVRSHTPICVTNLQAHLPYKHRRIVRTYQHTVRIYTHICGSKITPAVPTYTYRICIKSWSPS